MVMKFYGITRLFELMMTLKKKKKKKKKKIGISQV